MNLTIIQAGEEVLRKQAHPLTRDEILREDTQQLIDDMRETMRGAPGVGLAAPQVGVSLQIAVIEDRAEYHSKLTQAQVAERERRPVRFHVLINPRIVSTGDGPLEFFEGCLSITGYMAIVPRSRRITVEYLDEKAQPVCVEAKGWYARILQHEIDHLGGHLYIDRMYTESFCSLENYEQLWKDLPVGLARQRLVSR